MAVVKTIGRLRRSEWETLMTKQMMAMKRPRFLQNRIVSLSMAKARAKLALARMVPN